MFYNTLIIKLIFGIYFPNVFRGFYFVGVCICIKSKYYDNKIKRIKFWFDGRKTEIEGSKKLFYFLQKIDLNEKSKSIFAWLYFERYNFWPTNVV